MAAEDGRGRNLIAEQKLVLESAAAGIQLWFASFEDSITQSVRHVDYCLDAPARHRDVSIEIRWQFRILRDLAKLKAMSMFRTVALQCDLLHDALWTAPRSGSSGGGHLRDYVGGEPVLPPRQSWVPVELTVPEPSTINLGIASQNPEVGDCFLVGAIRHLATAYPHWFASLAAPDPADPDYVIVRVGAGEYRLRATLAVNDDTNSPAGMTSPDGTTLAPYIEKAAAAHFGSFEDLDGGRAPKALAWLVGEDAVETVGNVADLSDLELTAALGHRGCIVSINSVLHPEQPPDLDTLEQSGVADAHVYNVAGMGGPTGAVVLSNTWGALEPHPGPVDLDTLRRLKVELAWIKSPPSTAEDG